jgi:hypothetical protein
MFLSTQLLAIKGPSPSSSSELLNDNTKLYNLHGLGPQIRYLRYVIFSTSQIEDDY